MDELKSTIDSFISNYEKNKSNIDTIANALKQTANTTKNGETILPDGSIQKVSKSLGANGKPVFTVTKNDKNTMTFSTKKQLTEYLGD